MKVNERKNWSKNKKKVSRISLPVSGISWIFRSLSGVYLQPVLRTILMVFLLDVWSYES